MLLRTETRETWSRHVSMNVTKADLVWDARKVTIWVANLHVEAGTPEVRPWQLQLFCKVPDEG